MLIFTRQIKPATSLQNKFIIIMIRKITLFFLFFIGIHSFANAQVRDSITIFMPPYTDTTCNGTQLTFRAVQSNDTFSNVTYRWYADNVFTGVIIDTFLTTALNDGDSVYCKLYFTNSTGLSDSSLSNTIIVHHAAVIPPNVLISLIVGNNPDCAGHPLTFSAYPINGGTNPKYQWMINGVPVTGADSSTFTEIFGGGDTISCLMVSNSPCAPFDSVYSSTIPIIHIHLTQSVNITVTGPVICAGGLDTFTAYASGYGSGINYQWYINNLPVPGAITYQYITPNMHDQDSAYCVVTTLDSCVLNPIDTSNYVHMTVFHNQASFAMVNLTAGTNPGCLTDPVTFTATYDSFGVAPVYNWYVNGALYAAGVTTITGIFNNNDIVSFHIQATDGACYVNDSLNLPGVVMIRDTTPIAPIVSLIGDILVTYSSGVFTWFYSPTNLPGSWSIVPGATDSTSHPIALGYYYCIANNFDCPSPHSNTIFISLLEINDINKTDVKLYPNPVNNTLTIDWGNASVKMDVSIINTIGQNIAHQTIENSPRFNMDVTNLPSGNYFVELKDDGGKTKTYKILVEHSHN